jgi:hypothetical protein
MVEIILAIFMFFGLLIFSFAIANKIIPLIGIPSEMILSEEMEILMALTLTVGVMALTVFIIRRVLRILAEKL